MNTEIRLLSEIGDPKDLADFFFDWTEAQIIDYIETQFDALIEQLDVGLTPTNLVAHLFETSGYLYGPDYIEDFTRILTKKTEDYNADKIDIPGFRLDSARLDYFPFGEESYLQMIHTKIHRMKSVVLKDQANFESIHDSCIDLCSYLVFFYSYLIDRDVLG